VTFLILKGTHLVTVTVTLVLFLLRISWAFAGSEKLRMPLMRWLPHANDTLLFASAFATAAAIGQFPFSDAWLTAKFLAMLAYIVLGHIALWRARSVAERALWTAAALATFGWIVLVARCHDPDVVTCLAG